MGIDMFTLYPKECTILTIIYVKKITIYQFCLKFPQKYFLTKNTKIKDMDGCTEVPFICWIGFYIKIIAIFSIKRKIKLGYELALKVMISLINCTALLWQKDVSFITFLLVYFLLLCFLWTWFYEHHQGKGM